MKPYRVATPWRLLRLGFLGLLGVLGIAGLVGYGAPAWATDASDNRHFPILPHVTVLDDPTAALTLADVQQTPHAQRFIAPIDQIDRAPNGGYDALNFNITRSAIWLRITLRNEEAHTLDRVLEIRSPRLGDVQLFSPDAQGRYQRIHTGLTQPMSSRPGPGRFFAFPVALPAQSAPTYYLRIQSRSPIVMPIRLWQPDAFHDNVREDFSRQVWYFGMAGTLILFNLLIFVSLRERIFLFYVFSALAMVLALAEGNGMAKYYLWPNSSSEVLLTQLFALAVSALLLFSRDLLDLRRLMPRADWLFKRLIMLYLLAPVSLMVWPDAISIVTPMNATLTFLAFFVSLACVRKGHRPAGFFAAGYGLLVTGIIIAWLRGGPLIPINAFTIQSIQLGSALEMLIFSVALADRFNRLRLDKERAQASALAAQQLVVANLKTSERLLEERVAQRTAELTTANAGLHAAHEQQRQMMSMLSHEFRTPLAAISRSAQMILHTQTGSESTRIEGIRKRADELYALVDRFLVSEALDHRGATLVREDTELAALIHAAVATLEGAARIHVTVHPEAACYVLDRQFFPLALGNLLNNALSYSPADSPVELSARLTAHELTLSVTDHGCGMSAEAVARLGTPYFRAAGTQDIRGVGLGFVLTRKIVAAHGGTVEVSSHPGQGTVITLHLPVEAPA